VASLKRKGDLAELKVAADLADRGCQVSFPFGEDCDYDLIADLGGVIHRVQVKYTESDGRIIVIRCRSHSLTKGKVRQTKYYTAKTIDWIAVYDRTSDRCYYCPASELGTGRSDLSLRLAPARNGQQVGIRLASEYVEPDLERDPRMEPAGLEPATSALQTLRSSS
jgi:PD-(D/E)XK endonuclease